MTKRERQARWRHICDDLLATIHRAYPNVETIDFRDDPTGTSLLRVYSPYSDTTGILDCVAPKIVDLAVDDNLHILVIPLTQRPDLVSSAAA